jgi:hypothetical protein
MLKHNVHYTSSAKEDVSVDYEHIDDVTYLKRAFVWRDGWMFAPLDKMSIHEMLQWCRPSNIDINEIMQSTFDSFCNHMVHYPKEEFDEYVDHVLSIACDLPEPVELKRHNFQTLLKDLLDASY